MLLLFLCQISPLAARERIIEGNIREAYTLEEGNVTARCGDHSLDLMVLALGERYDSAEAVRIADKTCRLALIAVGKSDRVCKALLGTERKRLVALEAVFLRYVMLRREKVVRRLSVIGEYHHTDGIAVKSTHGEKLNLTKLVRKELGHDGKF